MRKVFLRAAAAAFLLAVFCLRVPAGEARDMVLFTDSAGRAVELPGHIGRIAPSGSLAQVVLFSLCPDRLIGWSAAPTGDMRAYLAEEYVSLPTFGQFYGKNVNLNLEALIAARPDVVIDVGEAKPSIGEDMDGIQEQIGIPVVFIEATLDTMPAAYRTLGRLAGMEAEAERLADYCAAALEETKRLSGGISHKIRLYYAEGDDGLQTDPSGSIHADVIDLIGALNVADIKMADGAGMGRVSMEQLLLWDPDAIIVEPDTIYEKMGEDPLWRELRAVKQGSVYEIPNGPYNWMGRPPSINRLIGLKWLGNLLYPEVCAYDMIRETQEFYRLFYHYDLSAGEAAALMQNSTFKAK